MTDQTLCCDVIEACICDLGIDHDGPHICDCGGSWEFDDRGEFRTVKLPGGMSIRGMLYSLGFSPDEEDE